MSTSAEKLKLFIDLDICSTGECEKCDIQCSFFYHSQKPVNNGIVSVAELAKISVVSIAVRLVRASTSGGKPMEGAKAGVVTKATRSPLCHPSGRGVEV